MKWHVLGIRHHGPGCARSLLAALDELKPDVIVMEGPADAEAILASVSQESMQPPIAMLLYPPEEPRRGVYYPFATFSPEWQTLRWASQHHVPIKLMDLPQSLQLAQEDKTRDEAESDDEATPIVAQEPIWRTDPIAVLAEAAGFTDHELWWEEQVERREYSSGLFQAILEAMTAVREAYPEARPRDLLREAHMRQVLRRVKKDLFHNIAVICGAYHAPVLTEDALRSFPIKEDAALLQWLPKIKTAATWIPWSHTRLSYRSGYGAGVHSPGWYQTIWEHRQTAPMHFIAQAARLLRTADLDASSASVIETLRLAETLAALREVRSPGLNEINEAIHTVLCHGQDGPLQLIHDRLEVGDVIGTVPDDMEAVPLARDLEQQQKSLRLKRSSETKTLDLDLRKDNDLARSHLFHRLQVLSIDWATLQPQQMSTSTFHEYWQLTWKPELAVEVIEANLWGNTVELAATQKAVDLAQKSNHVAALASLFHQALQAQLDPAIPAVLQQLQNQATLAADVLQLMQAIPSLARIVRYSDVRQTQANQVLPIIQGMLTRILVGLVPACSSLDDEAAQAMMQNIQQVHQALELLQQHTPREDWLKVLQQLMHREIHGEVRGGCCRILLDTGSLTDESFHRIARLALSPAHPPAQVAAWAIGLLRGSGMVLLHQDELWRMLDQWLIELAPTTFIELLPLLRRAFADFTGPERQAMGEKVKHLGVSPVASKLVLTGTESQLNVDRARLVLPTLRHILGLDAISST